MCIHAKYSSDVISITCAFAAYSFVLHLSFIKKTAHYAFSAQWAIRTLFYFIRLNFRFKSTLKSAQTASAAGAPASPLYTSHISNAGNDAEDQQRDDHSRNDVGVDGTHSGDIGVVALEHEAHDEAEAHSQSRFCLSTHSLSHDVPPI